MIKIGWKEYSLPIRSSLGNNCFFSNKSNLFSKHNGMVIVLLIFMFLCVDCVFGIYTSKMLTIQPGAEYNVIDLEGSGFGFLNGGKARMNFTTRYVCRE